MPARRAAGGNPADFVLPARLREPIRFTDLSERLALKISALPGYLSRAHFESWHRRLGAPDFDDFSGIFTPLVHVELEVTDAPIPLRSSFVVRGQNHLGKTLDAHGAIRHLVREGVYTVATREGAAVGRARLVNVFTRYDADPDRRRVTELPAGLGLGSAPSRVVDLPEIVGLLPGAGRRPDFVESASCTWHYSQTDANRHVNGMEYLRSMEDFVSCALAARGHDLRTLFPARARILFRKPCFRGEGYRREAWFLGEAPLLVAGAFRKAGDSADAPPAVVVEITFGTHQP